MSVVSIAITGATGYVGSHVARLLANQGVRQRLIGPDPHRLPSLPHADTAVVASYGDVQGMRDALRDVQTLFLISARESVDRVEQHKTAINAAAAAGVERIVYLSYLSAAPDATFTFARHHFATEEYIRSTGLDHAFLRDGPYLDYVPMLAGPDGVIRGPAGDGRMAPLARDDIARAAVTILLHEPRASASYDLVGREDLTMTDCAAVLSEVTGRPIQFHNETEAEAWASRRHYGAPDWEVEGWITTYLGIARGEMGPASDIIERLTETPAQTLREFLQSHPESYHHLLTGQG
jgi:NAD(P)H dehydrogenase (quinone)